MDPRTSAQDVMRCDLCETAVVQMHCDSCLVNLCKACVGEHMVSDQSKKHEVVQFKLRKSTLLFPVCKIHDKKEDIIKEKNELNETIYPTYQYIAFDVQNRMSQLEKKYGDLSTAITKHGEDWHREIDELVQKLKAEVEKMKNTQLQTLQKHLDEINKIISDIKDEIDSLDVAVKSNDMSKIFKSTFSVERYRNLPQKVLPSLPTFTPCKIKGQHLSKIFGTVSSSSPTSDKYGYSMKTTKNSPEAGSSPPVKQLLDEPETVTTINTRFYNLYNVACLSDEEIWTRGGDSTMKLYSINLGSLLKSIRTKSGYEPSDIAVTKSGDLVYTDISDRTVN
ncbi:uncharacterized protein LOC134247777 [Saccostrea cucullata]|uniref:uncharacterized protein LOC134247777 n=1 Tax=Saccostrea cuccullata TaxID=36930 RepID=UPI002ED137F5